jgi:hypothetical protein
MVPSTSPSLAVTLAGLLLAAQAALVCGLDNGAALTPPCGFNPWQVRPYEFTRPVPTECVEHAALMSRPCRNGFKMNFNGTLIVHTAEAMKENGLLAAGYSYLTLGGSTYLHAAVAPYNRSGGGLGHVIVRNSTGHVQIDPARYILLRS